MNRSQQAYGYHSSTKHVMRKHFHRGRQLPRSAAALRTFCSLLAAEEPRFAHPLGGSKKKRTEGRGQVTSKAVLGREGMQQSTE
jgi:hypothetical protein